LRIEKTLPEKIAAAELKFDNVNTMLFDIIRTISESMIENGKPTSYINLRRFPKNPSINRLIHDFTNDGPARAMFTTHAHWLTGKKEIFNISPDFFDMFQKITLKDMLSDALPKDMCGYCSLPTWIDDGYGDRFNGFYFFSGPGKKFMGGNRWAHLMHGKVNEDIRVDDDMTNILSFSWVDSGHNINFSTMPWNPEDLLKDVFAKTEFVHKERLSDVKVKGRREELEDGFADHLRLMCNLLVYLNSGKPDLRPFRNQIKYQSPTSKTPVRADKVLSQSDITLVGFGYKKSPIYEKEFWIQPPYWAHRYYGPARTEKRYMLIKGSFKQRRSEMMSEKEEEQFLL